MRAAAAPLGELPEPPVVRAVNGVAKFALTAAENPATGQESFEFQGAYNVAPTIEINPGDTIEIALKNDLPSVPPAGEARPQPMATGMTDDVNLHFHGLGVSPHKPGDDVLTMLATPGTNLHYVVHVPKTQEPGLYWYHTHVHGQTALQVGNDGMSGAIVVEGLERHLPGLAKMKHRVIVLRDPGQEDDAVPEFRNPNPCGPDPGFTVTLNNQVQPAITIAPGEQQFFRLVNASSHKVLKLAVDGEKLELVAVDGFALDSYRGTPPTVMESTIIVPPAGRAEFVVTGPASGHAAFRTKCFDSGLAGDPDPETVLATLQAPAGSAHQMFPRRALTVGAPLLENGYTSNLPPIAAKRVVVLSEGPKRFYINGKSFREGEPPTFVVHTGTVEEWRIENVTKEIHDFHIHQVHFFVKSIDGVPVVHPHWADTVIVPPRQGRLHTGTPGEIVAIMDFRDPIIKGTFLFHCHILDHEDHGMMAKIEAI